MNKQELKKKFEANVLYLMRNIPPDDIYLFAEHTLMAAMFFISKWSKYETLDEMLDDPIGEKWLKNIFGFLDSRDKEEDISLNLNLESLDEDNP